jgi:hypothetical protein
MAHGIARRPRTDAAGLPQWIRPQLTELVDEAPDGPAWLHEIKYDGYRMQARLAIMARCGCSPAPGSTGRTNTRRSPRPCRRSMPARPISTLAEEDHRQ